MSEVKIILLCGGKLAVPALQQLAFLNMLSAVVIPKHCKEMIIETDHILDKMDIPVLEVNRETYVQDITEAVTEFQANVGLIITFSYILPASVYNLPAKGFYNIHPGSLPAYRGPDPIFRQIKNKEKYAAVTLHKIAEDFDAGDVVMEERVTIDARDTHGILTYKLSLAAVRLLAVFIKLISFDLPVRGKKQDETKANYYRKQKADDASINWQTMNADVIIALINACNPWNKGAITKISGKIVRLLQAEKITPANNEAKGGIILSLKNEMIVSTINNEAIQVNFIYVDEGFVKPAYLLTLGVRHGNSFEI